MKISCNWRAGLGYKLILNFKTHLFCLVLPHFWHVAYTIFEETIAHIFPLRSGSHFGENSLDWAGFSLYILNTTLLCFIHKGFKWFHFLFFFYWRRCGLVVSTLDFRSRGRWFEPGHCCRVVSLDKKLYSSLSLFTQVYKWVPAIKMRGGNLVMD